MSSEHYHPFDPADWERPDHDPAEDDEDPEGLYERTEQSGERAGLTEAEIDEIRVYLSVMPSEWGTLQAMRALLAERDALVAERARLAAENLGLRGSLNLAAVRMGILIARMRACHDATGNHELLAEGELFVAETKRAALSVEGGTDG